LACSADDCLSTLVLQGRLPLDIVSHELRQQLRLAQTSHGPGPTAAAAAAGAAAQQGGGRSSSMDGGGAVRGAAAGGGVVGFSHLYSWGNGSNFTLGTGEH